jgi:hypothetical protein
MNAREKTLAMIVGTGVALFGGILVVRAILLKPIKDLDKKNVALQERLVKIKAERRAYFEAEDQVKEFARHTFADQVDKASAKSGETFTRQILASGLQEADFSRLPVGPRKLPGANEIGWSVQGSGPLEKVVNLLFLLQEAAVLHRIENLVVSAGDTPGEVKVRFRYLTLVLDPTPEVEPADLQAKVALNSPQRRIYDSIISRDILRPYIKRPPAAPNDPNPAAPVSAPKGPPGPESLRVVSLSEWQGQPEVHVRDLAAEKTLRFKPGDNLAGGVVVMVDYRPMPRPGNEVLKSFSRVIIQIGAEYWAVERGQTLAEKYKLSPAQLPENLPHR